VFGIWYLVFVIEESQFVIPNTQYPITNHQVELFQQVGQVRQVSEVTGTLNSSSHPALVLQRVAGDAAWKHFTLFVDELQQKVSVFDAELAETAVFLTLLTYIWIAEKLDIVS